MHQTAAAVVGYSVGLLGLIALKIVAPAFYARKDIRTPVRVACWSLICVQLVNCVSVPLFSQAGLALSVGIGSLFNAGTLLVLLKKRAIYTPQTGWCMFFAKIIFSAALMGAALYWGQTGWDWTAVSWTIRAAGVAVMVGAAAVIYFGLLFALGWRLRDIRD